MPAATLPVATDGETIVMSSTTLRGPAGDHPPGTPVPLPAADAADLIRRGLASLPEEFVPLQALPVSLRR